MSEQPIQDEINQITSGLAGGQPYGTQTEWPLRYVNAPGTNVPIIGYRGPGLVGPSNNVEPVGFRRNPVTGEVDPIEQYPLEDGFIRDFYAKMTPEQRATQLGILKKKGYYGRDEVGDPIADLQAIAAWLEEANITGFTAERYLTEMAKRKRDVSSGRSRPRYRVSNPEDLKAVFRRSAQEILGRGFTDEEASRAVQAYQQQEIAAQQAMYGGAQTVTEAPAADVFAQQYAQQIAPTEANAYKFLGILNRIANATTGGM